MASMPEDFWPEQVKCVGKHQGYELGFEALSKSEFEKRVYELRFALWQALQLEEIKNG